MTSLVQVNRSHPQFTRLNNKLRSPPNIQASPYAFAAYDSVQLIGKALEESRIDVESLRPSSFYENRSTMTAAINIVATYYEGLIGNTTLDENGDLASSNYELWQVREGNWTRIAGEENSGTGRLSTPTGLLISLAFIFSLAYQL